MISFITTQLENGVEIDSKALNLKSQLNRVYLPIDWLVKLFGINRSTFYRWQKNITDKRKGSTHPNFSSYKQEHEDRVVRDIKLNPDLSISELIATCLDRKDENGNSIGYYMGSRSYVWRVMNKHNLRSPLRSQSGKGAKHNINQKRLVATGPNQVWCWDITYLYKNIEGEYFYLYAIIDLFSRKMIHWEVHEKQRAELAATFLENALKKENLAISGHLNGKVSADISIADKLILHSDNGGPMKGANMLAKITSLGITPSYSRPHHSNDNAFIESSFATLKHCKSIRIPKCFDSIKQASLWVDKFYQWYNTKHLHSGINFITPNDCHQGLGDSIMEQRNEIVANSGIMRKKPYKMPGKVSLETYAIKRKVAESANKNFDYSNCGCEAKAA